jgi:hypothetical protein
MARATAAERKIIDTAMKRLKDAVAADDHNRNAAIEDLKFLNGEQWSQEEKKRRSDKGRPALTLNFLPKFVDQVVGDMLHNSPSIKIRPENSQADVAIAKIRQGIISSVEYQSNAKGIYSYAGKQMVSCGYGAWRILTRYTEENPFLQEAYLEGIRNPFLVYMDPSSKDQNYADAKWGFLLEKVPKDEFEERYPDGIVPSDGLKTGRGLSNELWYDGDNVTVAEYFCKEEETVIMCQLEDGRVVTEEEFDEIRKEWKDKQKSVLKKIEVGPKGGLNVPMGPPVGATPAPPVGGGPPAPMPGSPAPLPPAGPPAMGVQGAPAPQIMPGGIPQAPSPVPGPAGPNPLAMELEQLGVEPKVVKKRDTQNTVIRHRILTCTNILSGGKDGHKFPGKYIPLILLKGKELNIEGKNYVTSLVRNGKDPQKLINYWNSAAAETIALAPKAPWLGTAKQFEGFETDYASANVENFPMLKYNVDPEAAGPPQRQPPGQPPVAIFEQIRRGEENLKSVLGMFNADVGGNISQQTGEAVRAAQRPGDIGTFEFMENFSRAVMYTGRVLNEMIPEVYDTERDVRIRNFDESESFIPINTTVGSALKSVNKSPDKFQGIDPVKLKTLFAKEGKDTKYNDITAGKYSVVVTTGPSYATQRQESAAHLLQLTQSLPQQMAMAADLIVQNMDFKEADELAARLRKMLPPGMVKPRPGEAATPPPPNPQLQLAQAKMQLEQGKQQLQMMKIEQEKVKLEHEKIKMQLEMIKLQAESGNSNDRFGGSNPQESQEKAARLAMEAERLRLEREKFEHQKSHDYVKFGHNSAVEKIKLDNERRKIDGDMANDMMKNVKPIITSFEGGA